MIYLDNAATTPIRKEVLEAMLPYLQGEFGNPSTIYSIGRKARVALDDARRTVGDALNASPSEIFFTSGGTESDNWAIKGFARANAKKGKHIITSAIEHHAIEHSCEALTREGFEITYLPVDKDGIVQPETLKNALKPETILVSIMHANNEIGTIQPIEELAKITHEHGAKFHTDAVQTVAHIPTNVQEMGVDMLSLSAHKFGAPKGVGALYIKNGTNIFVFNDGGAQENNRRGGTENVAGIVGLATALKLATDELKTEMPRLKKLQDKLVDGLLSEIPDSVLNGSRTHRVPGNVNISFKRIEGEGMLLHLDMLGVCAASGSACTSGSLDPSHVLLAIGLDHATAHGSLRLSMGHGTTDEEIDFVLAELPKIVSKLRAMSPLK